MNSVYIKVYVRMDLFSEVVAAPYVLIRACDRHMLGGRILSSTGGRQGQQGAKWNITNNYA